MDNAKRAYLLDLGHRAFRAGLTTVDYIQVESLTLDYADAHVVHEGWCEARDFWWFSDGGPLAFN